LGNGGKFPARRVKSLDLKKNGFILFPFGRWTESLAALLKINRALLRSRIWQRRTSFHPRAGILFLAVAQASPLTAEDFEKGFSVCHAGVLSSPRLFEVASPSSRLSERWRVRERKLVLYYRRC